MSTAQSELERLEIRFREQRELRTNRLTVEESEELDQLIRNYTFVHQDKMYKFEVDRTIPVGPNKVRFVFRTVVVT